MYNGVHQEMAEKERLRLLWDPPSDELERQRDQEEEGGASG